MRWLLSILAFSLLAGCWTGGNLYTNADARQALPAGVYRMTGTDEPAKVFRVTVLPNGLTQFAGPEKAETYGFSPLDIQRGTFVAWMQTDDEQPSGEVNQAYALMQRQADGSFKVYAPSCKDEEAEIARKAGASAEEGMFASCRFPTRASLETAMRQFQPKDDKDALKLVRIGALPKTK
jgi:hypothetical protein